MKISEVLTSSVVGYTIMTAIFLTTTSCNTKKPNKITIIEEGDYNVIVMNKEAMKFGVSEGKPVNTDFYINSNFFKNEGPIGLVVIDGIRKNAALKGGGYFYVKKGIPFVQAKNCPKITEYASQTILWAIDNGRVNESLLKNLTQRKKDIVL